MIEGSAWSVEIPTEIDDVVSFDSGTSNGSSDTLEMVVPVFNFVPVDGVTARMFDTSSDDDTTAELAVEVIESIAMPEKWRKKPVRSAILRSVASLLMDGRRG